MFSLVSRLSPDTTKCEIAGFGTVKEVNVALCGTKYRIPNERNCENTLCKFLLQ